MRIISGKYKGRKISGFQIVGTRPTMDRVKESVFAMIQSRMKEAVCLDLFAGSGSLGFEALSQGADTCYFVDKNPYVIKTLKENQKQLNIAENVFLLEMDYKKALSLFKQKQIQFDIIFLDPPYNDHLLKPALQLIEEYQLVKQDGFIICEYENESFDSSYFLFREKKYGDKKIRIYQRK